MSCRARVWGAREALTLSAGPAPPGWGWAVHGDQGPHRCREAALLSIGSGRQTWSLAKAPAPGSQHPREAHPSWHGPGLGAPHAVALGAWALHRAGAPSPASPSLFLLLGRIPRGPTGSVAARQGAREGRPQPSHPARTPAVGLPVPLTCPTGWCDPSAWETVVTWQPSPSNLDPGPRGEQVEREGWGPGARGAGLTPQPSKILTSASGPTQKDFCAHWALWPHHTSLTTAPASGVPTSSNSKWGLQ